MPIPVLIRGSCFLALALVLAACGGGGGGTSADDIASKVGDRLSSEASCTESTRAGSDSQAFSCDTTYSGQSASVTVIENDDGTFNATVMVGGGIVDFFVVD